MKALLKLRTAKITILDRTEELLTFMLRSYTMDGMAIMVVKGVAMKNGLYREKKVGELLLSLLHPKKSLCVRMLF